MRLADVAETLGGRILTGGDHAGLEIDRAYAVDLLSDVLALTDERTTLITGNVSPQVIRVAEILNVIAIVFVRGKRPPESAVAHAESLGIPMVSTDRTMFETCGLLYAKGVRPCRNRPVSNPSG